MANHLQGGFIKVMGNKLKIVRSYHLRFVGRDTLELFHNERSCPTYPHQSSRACTRTWIVHEWSPDKRRSSKRNEPMEFKLWPKIVENDGKNVSSWEYVVCCWLISKLNLKEMCFQGRVHKLQVVSQGNIDGIVPERCSKNIVVSILLSAVNVHNVSFTRHH